MNANNKLPPTTWFPHPWQVIVLHNPSYLHSVFVGLTSPILNLPFMVWRLILEPVLRGVFGILGFTARSVFFGLTGWKSLNSLIFSKSAGWKFALLL